MLALTVKTGHSVAIGDNIKVQVVEVRPGRVRIAFDVPDSVTVLRDDAKAILDPIARAVIDERRNIGGNPNYGKDSK